MDEAGRPELHLHVWRVAENSPIWGIGTRCSERQNCGETGLSATNIGLTMISMNFAYIIRYAKQE